MHLIIKRVAIVVVPGALVGLILASFYCGFRKADGIYVMQNILTGFIVLAIVLLLNFKNLGAAIVTIVIKSVSTVIFMNITYYHENSLFYHSLFLKPRNTAEKIPFCEKVIQNGKTVLFDCAESVFQEKSPFMFFFTFAVQECLCQVPLYFFNSMRQMLVAIMFAMFCLIYNEEHSSKPSVWFTISIIFASTFGVSIETIFFYETNGGIDFFNFALLLAMLLSVAGKRREVKNLFCGWERSEYYDVLRTTTEVNSHMLCAPLESRAETLLHVRFPQHRLLRASSMTSILYDYLDYEGTFLHSRSMINHDLNIRGVDC
ncbi:uncharacterized protein LOC134856847 [Symsagittifera roscoffensis]|uniref:uncharacterized protein LOC134856847 n=1 Tax=Symsagittifera roscoffensis TaxID=84072 RepID=UPI00307C97D9